MLEDLSYQHSRLKEDERGQIEVLLVDNHSFDNTKEIAYKYAESTAMKLKYFLENKRSLAYARNSAIKQANGDLLAFMHDDVTLDEDWLKEALKLASTCQEREIGVYGGRSIPLWQERTPPWLNNMQAPQTVPQEVFTGHSYGDAETFYPIAGEFGYAKVPLGVNVMIRKEIFDNCGDFRTDLGPSASGTSTGLHDDYEFFDYLQTLQIPMLYVPQCIVFHPIHPDKMTPQSIRRWYFKSGKSLYWMAHTDRVKREPDPLFGVPENLKIFFPEFTAEMKILDIPAYLYLKVAYLFLWWLFEWLSMNQSKRYWLTFEFSKVLGEIQAVQLVKETEIKQRFSFKDRLKSKQIS